MTEQSEWVCLAQAHQITGLTNLDRPARRKGIRTKTVVFDGRRRVVFHREDCQLVGQRRRMPVNVLAERWLTTPEASELTGRSQSVLRYWRLAEDLISGVLVLPLRGKPQHAYEPKSLRARAAAPWARGPKVPPEVLAEELDFFRSCGMTHDAAIARLADAYRMNPRTIERTLTGVLNEGVAA